MPKLIDYPRTSYAGAWELGEIVDDTGGKCAVDTAARKLNRKVSGSFKAIIGSSVKFGLLVSKRDLLTTTTLFKRIKHAYDKQEELIFHREAFLTPPLFTQICRKFRSRELPVQMLDIMLIREFSVEEINAPGVAKAFIEGCRMVGLLDEHNIIADIDALTARTTPRRELANPQPDINTFRDGQSLSTNNHTEFNPLRQHLATELNINQNDNSDLLPDDETTLIPSITTIPSRPAANQLPPSSDADAIANLFGLPAVPNATPMPILPTEKIASSNTHRPITPYKATPSEPIAIANMTEQSLLSSPGSTNKPAISVPVDYQIQVSGPGVNTLLSITEVEDIDLAVALLEKIRRQLRVK